MEEANELRAGGSGHPLRETRRRGQEQWYAPKRVAQLPVPLRATYLTSPSIRLAISLRSRWLRVITSTVSSPAIVPMISDQPA